MNDFDQRWHSATRAAHSAPHDPAELPFGFATRVLARFENNPAESWVDLFTALGLRAVLASALVFIASAALVAAQCYDSVLSPTLIETPLSPRVFLP